MLFSSLLLLDLAGLGLLLLLEKNNMLSKFSKVKAPLKRGIAESSAARSSSASILDFFAKRSKTEEAAAPSQQQSQQQSNGDDVSLQSSSSLSDDVASSSHSCSAFKSQSDELPVFGGVVPVLPLPADKKDDEPVLVNSSQYDIGLFVNKRDIDDHTKTRLLEPPWTPAENYKFPSSEHMKLGKTVSRSINHTHLKRHHWLAVSDIDGGLYCKFCVLFASPDVGSGRRSNVGTLVKCPLKSFSKLYGKDGALDVHENTKYHINAVAAGKDFLHTYQNPSLDILNRLDAQRLAEVQDNRQRLLPILKSIVFCGQQNIALRGHRDDGSLLDGDVEAKPTGAPLQRSRNMRQWQ